MTLTSDLVFRILVPRSYLILFEVGTPKLVCACNLGWQSVAYHPWVTVTFTPDLVSRISIESGAYLLIFFEVGIPNLVYECNLRCGSVTYHIRGHCDIELDLVLE